MKLIPISPSAWESNSYLVIENGKALLVDAGAPFEKISAKLREEEAELRAILLTHGHFDHILTIDKLREAYSVPVYVQSEDALLLTDSEKNAYSIFFGGTRTWRPAEKLLSDGDIIPFEGKQIKVLHTPGHTRGSVCYLMDDILFSGDTVFSNGYGRIDLDGGDFAALTKSLARLFALDESITAYPGHGIRATLGQIKHNLGF